MEIAIKAKALKTLDEAANYIDSLNTPNAGSRWLDRFLNRMQSYAKPGVVYALCSYKPFAKRGYSCITYNNWVVAFKIVRNQFVIYEIMHGSVLH